MNKDFLVKLIPISIIVIGTGILSFVFYRQYRSGALSSKLASLRVESLNDESLEVFIDGDSVGNTPLLLRNLKPGRIVLKLVGKANSYTTTLDLYEGTQTVVNRLISSADLLSAGEVIWLEPSLGGNQFGLNVVGSPEGALVTIDGREEGSIPYISNNLSPDEHTLTISAVGYQSRGLRVSLESGYRLNVAVQLPAIPAPEGILEKIETAESARWGVLDLSLPNSPITSVPSEWAKAVAVWYEQNPLGDQIQFDYYLDYQGTLYDRKGRPLSLDDISPKEEESGAVLVIGYLGNTADKALASAAQDTLTALGEKLGVSLGRRVSILPTGTGWLRVRSTPGFSGVEVAKVDVGDEFPVIEESGSWVKIKVDDETEGWVSGVYVEEVVSSSE